MVWGASRLSVLSDGKGCEKYTPDSEKPLQLPNVSLRIYHAELLVLPHALSHAFFTTTL